MEKTALVVILLGIALLAYSPITELYKDELKSCSCGSIQDMVAWAEGNKACVYKDSLGIPTIGIGFNLKRSDARKLITSIGANYDSVLSGSQCLTPAQITSLFNNDLAWAKSGAQSCVPSFSSHHKCIQNVLMDMTFNMGKGKHYYRINSYSFSVWMAKFRCPIRQKRLSRSCSKHEEYQMVWTSWKKMHKKC